ncbi:MAG: sugar O-acetyltransferase [Cetobacterium sp.]|uniref:sugar O-acetyltransferase n=1 Tax=unclassified Cetobacterium TaxID=2630983 RepID=UPI000646C484|nr:MULTISPECIES: sugar O-acetyltransferase [unclassified Cetobacterium]
MTLDKFLEYMNNEKVVIAGSDVHKYMISLTQDALRLTSELNNKYHTSEEICEIFSKITGKKVEDSFILFPPFHTNCGKNITIGKNVFINSNCQFQDQGGIRIGDGTLIGPNVLLATLNHGIEPEKRGNLYPKSIQIGKGVWIGGNVSILPGVVLGDNVIVAAGSTVTKSFPSNCIIAGIPAKIIKELKFI